jgi:hypothetical protein
MGGGFVCRGLKSGRVPFLCKIQKEREKERKKEKHEMG